MWVFSSLHAKQNAQSLIVNYREFVRTSRGRVDAVEFGYRDDAVDIRQAIDLRDDTPFLGVKNSQPVCAQVRDIKSAALAVQILVVESRGAARQRNVHDFLQR